MKLKLTTYQQDLIDRKEKYVVARWGRRTGKDTVIGRDYDDENDLIIYPTFTMARIVARDVGIRRAFSEADVMHDPRDYTNDKPFRRIVIMEAALFDDLAGLLKRLEKRFKFEQLYIISTPLPNDKISSSGFFFEAMCHMLDRTTLPNYYYTQVGISDAPYADEKWIDDLKKMHPLMEKELEAKL